MSVVFLTRSFFPNIGGVEKHIYKLSEALTKKGIKVTILTEKSYSNNYHSQSLSANQPENSNLNVITIDIGRNDWFKKFRIWKELLLKINLIKNADIVHAHDVYFWYFPFRFIFPFKKNFVTFHGYEGNNLPSFNAYLMHKVAEVLSNGNICVGKFLEKWYKTKANFIIYGAVDKKLIESKVKENVNRYKGIFTGRLEHETGILEYLKAFKLLKDKNVATELDIYGDGTLREEAIKYAKKHKLKVFFKGFVQDTDSLFLNYGFALVSRYLGILEAMASRIPVFAHYNNEIKKDYLEMTPFAGYIAISNDSGKIAEAIKSYLEHNQQSTAPAYNWVKTKSWERITNIYLDLWNLNDLNK